MKMVISRAAVFACLFASVAVSALAQEPQSLLSLSASQIEVDRLAPGAVSGEARFAIDDADMVKIEIISTLQGLTTSIRGPKGETVNSGNIASLKGQFATFEGGSPGESGLLLPVTPGFHYLYTFPSLGEGEYRVLFSAPANLNKEVAVITQVETDSRIGAALFIPRQVVGLGEPVVLTVPFLEGRNPVRGGTVTASVFPPTGPPQQVTLLDDGGDADDKAGDGLYSGMLTPGAVGEYQVAVNVRAQGAGGTPCIREVGGSFRVVAASGRLAGTFTDRGEDLNFNRLFDRVVVDVAAMVAQAGEYQVSVELATAGGRRLRRSGRASLQAGNGGVPVVFEGSALRALGENGPYQVRSVSLVFLSSEGAVEADSRSDLGSTSSYLLTQLERPALALTGANSDQGTDTNQNGRFDELRVKVGVEVATSGVYSWSLKLTDGSFQEIEFASGSGFLNAGRNTLDVVFDGQAIGAFGANGPYRLRDLLVSGPAALVQIDVGQTQSYQADQFEGASSRTCTPGPNVTCLNGGRFKVEVDWRDFGGNRGRGQVLPFGSDDSGLFWFFGADNWEMLVKVLNGCSSTRNFWVFAAATTDVEYTLRVTDTQNGAVRTYSNPLGRRSPAVTDTSAFSCGRGRLPGALVESQTIQEPETEEPLTFLNDKAPCTPGPGRLCFVNGRFRVTVDWRDFSGKRGSGTVVPVPVSFRSDNSGLFWFFHEDNWEMLVKVLDGCGSNRRFWVFAAATTNVEYTLRVQDTQTGTVKEYRNPLGRAANAITDVDAFSCPRGRR